MKKRVLIFSTAYLPLVGGAEVAVKEITDRISDVDFVMITSRLKADLPEHEKIGNINIYRIGKGNKWDKFRLIFSGYKKAKELGEFDLVWSIMASYAGFASLKYKKRNKKVPFLLTLQEGDSRWDIYKHVWFIWPYFKQIFKKADKIQAISSYLADWAKGLGAKCDIDVVPNGIVVQKVKIQKKSNDLKRVITASRIVKKNGLKYLIKAIKKVNDNYSQPVILKIIGDGELREKLQKLVKRLKINDRFVIKETKKKEVVFEGTVTNKQVYEYLSQADVFVRPSLSEGLGNAFLEAMAMGVPVIATPVGGIPDFLEDGKTGWFCKVKDDKSIAEKIKYILDEKNKEEVEEVVKNAKKLVEEKYSWDLIAKKMNKLMI
jgi:glycosyltransferase involved in cell wall biosynthesis